MSADLGAALAAALNTAPDAVRALDGHAALRGRELLARADRIARALGDAGVRGDEPVLVACSNRAADVAAFLGVWRAGAVVVPLHRSAVAASVAAVRGATGARLRVDAAPGRETSLPGDGEVVTLAVPAPPRRPLLDAAAAVIFTSGSTGEPKGVVLGHRAFAAKLDAIDAELRFAPGDVALVPLQLTFAFGQWVTLLTLLRGGVVELLDGPRPQALLARLARGGVHRLAAVPTMLRALLAHDAPDVDFDGLVLAGGEVLPADLGHALLDRWPRAGLWDIYGSTETGTCDFFVRATDYRAAAGSIGRPGAGIDYRVDPRSGELQIRTPYRMLGYLDRDDPGAAAFDGDWFRTGDMARERADGRVELIGRLKELVNRGGNKIAPLAVERVFARHPDVAAVLATGVPDARMGEAVHLLVVARTGVAPDADALRDWARTRMEPFMLPDSIHFAAELPTGRTGKADRGVLRAQIIAAIRSAEDVRPPAV